MFYLVEFVKSIGESLIRGMSFFLFSCLLAFCLTHRPWVGDLVEKISPEKMVNPYFVAVMDGEVDSNLIKNTMTRFPGVISISERTQAEDQGKIQNLLNKLGPDYGLSADLMDFKTVRVSLNPSLSQESLEFVREQVKKLGSDDHLNVSDVKYPEVTGLMKAHPFYSFIERAGDWGIVGLCALAWIMSYWLCYNIFRSRSYLIEKYQRKKFVAPKALAAGLGSVVVLFTGLGLMNGTLKFFDLILLLMIFSIFWTFSMQEWRWKPTL